MTNASSQRLTTADTTRQRADTPHVQQQRQGGTESTDAVDGSVDGWLDGWRYGRMDGWTDRGMDGWTEVDDRLCPTNVNQRRRLSLLSTF